MILNMQQIATEQLVQGIVNRIDRDNFEETLQDALDGLLGALTDEVRADLYARIVTRHRANENNYVHQPDNWYVAQCVRFEMNNTNLWK